MPTLVEARQAGAISTRNSKMPGSTFAVSATKCNVGSKLAQIEGSTCHRCYALKLEKLRPSVRIGWGDNYLKATRMIAERPDVWAKAMAFQITKAAEKTGENYHRWFDSGDLASLDMLNAIVAAVELTPHIQHWLPTREAGVVKAFLKTRAFPSNLVVRVSATMIDDQPIAGHTNTSTVHRKDNTPVGHSCPASHQGNSCGACRACWTPSVVNVSYPLH